MRSVLFLLFGLLFVSFALAGMKPRDSTKTPDSPASHSDRIHTCTRSHCEYRKVTPAEKHAMLANREEQDIPSYIGDDGLIIAKGGGGGGGGKGGGGSRGGSKGSGGGVVGSPHHSAASSMSVSSPFLVLRPLLKAVLTSNSKARGLLGKSVAVARNPGFVGTAL